MIRLWQQWQLLGPLQTDSVMQASHAKQVLILTLLILSANITEKPGGTVTWPTVLDTLSSQWSEADHFTRCKTPFDWLRHWLTLLTGWCRSTTTELTGGERTVDPATLSPAVWASAALAVTLALTTLAGRVVLLRLLPCNARWPHWVVTWNTPCNLCIPAITVKLSLPIHSVLEYFSILLHSAQTSDLVYTCLLEN